MSACTNPELGAKLHAYELGILSEEECKELELHMLECPECDAQADSFEAAAAVIRESSEVRDIVTATEEPRESWWRRHVTPRIYVPALAAAAVLLILVLSPDSLAAPAARGQKKSMKFDDTVLIPYDPDRLFSTEESSKKVYLAKKKFRRLGRQTGPQRKHASGFPGD